MPKFTKKLLVLTLFIVTILQFSFAQLSQTLTPEATNASFELYPKPDGADWEDHFHSYEYGDRWFRLLEPNNYNSSREEPYPLIVFFHGRGERGTNNRGHLNSHGGKIHHDAVRVSEEFPGLLLYPQIPGSSGNFKSHINEIRLIVRKLVQYYNVDPNRIYVNGLSMGGGGAWDFLVRNPKIIATAYPMSDVGGYNGTEYIRDDPAGGSSNNLSKILCVPLWYYQGGLDQGEYSHREYGNNLVNTIREEGGEIRYIYDPNAGHGRWTENVFTKPDFFTNMLTKSKLYILKRYGQTSFCEGEPIDVTLAITDEYSDYEWQKADLDSDLENPASWTTVASGPSNHEFTANSSGYYRVRFKWPNDLGLGSKYSGKWTNDPSLLYSGFDGWSVPVRLDNDKPLTTAISTTSNGSLTLPALDGSTSANLIAPQGFDNYKWLKWIDESNTTLVSGADSYILNTNQAGTYSASVWENSPDKYFSANGLDNVPVEYRVAPPGCPSNPSNPITVSVNGSPDPATPNNFFVTSQSTSGIKINWDDLSSNETGFEIYRATQSGGPYQLVTITGAKDQLNNPQSYTDVNLISNITYYYRLRAVNDIGGSSYTQERNAKTAIDLQAPTAPILSVVSTTRSSVNLQWSNSFDDGIIDGYEVYRNGSLIDFTTNSSYVATGLSALTNYAFSVKARDAAGNTSNFSNQVYASTVNQSLNYKYYTTPPISSISEIESQGTLIGEGSVNNFDLNVRYNHTPSADEYFAVTYEGSLFVENGGNYKFYLNSDDGSILYIDGIERVNHDGLHGCSQKEGNYFYLSSGNHTIKVLFFERTGGECLEVRWERQGGSPSKQLIPSSNLKDNISVPSAPSAPNNLQADVISYTQINLSWSDNSNNETGFEIYRRQSGSGEFSVINTTSANATTFSDNNLLASTLYEYKVKSINGNASSSFSNTISATTNSAPTPPNAPSNLQGTFTNNEIQLTWEDNSTNEIGFEIYRTTSSDLQNWTLIHTASIDIEDFVDNTIYGLSTYYYQIRAKGSSSFSTYSNSIEVSTGSNNSPVIEPISNQSLIIGEGPLIINITTTDSDEGDQITLNVENLPSFGSFEVLEGTNKNGTISLSPGIGEAGTYTINITADDINGGHSERSFTLTVLSSAPGEAPIPPSNVVIQAESPTALNISWTDNANNEDNYFVYRALSFSGPFSEVVSLAPNSTTFTDESLSGNTAYYYKIIAENSDGAGESSIFTGTTLNSSPNFVQFESGIYLKAGETLQVDISVSDPENDEISILPEGFRDFMTFEDNGDGTANIILSPKQKHIGHYGNMKIVARDILNGEVGKNIYVIVDNPIFNEQIFVNFNNSIAAGNPWNNTGTPGTNINLLNSEGNNSGISLTSSGFDSSIDNGYSTSNNDGYFDNKVISSQWSTSNSNATLTFSNLDNDKVYNITIFGSDTEINVTSYTIDSNTKSLDILENSSEYLVFNTSGTDNLNVTINNSSGNKGVINAIVIRSYDSNVIPEPGEFKGNAVSETEILLQWKDNAGNETGFELLRRKMPEGEFTLIGVLPPNTEAYSDGALSLNSSYQYSLRALGANNIKSSVSFIQVSTLALMVKINMNTGSPEDESVLEDWNHLENTFITIGSQWDNLTNANANTTSLSFSVPTTDGINTYNVGGKYDVPAGNEGEYPNEVRKSLYYINSDDEPSSLVLSGLDERYYYDIEILSSARNDALAPDIPLFYGFTRFELNGNIKDVDAVDNIDDYVLYQKNIPDENGQIEIKLMVNNEPDEIGEYFNYGIINAMIIRAYKNPDAITPQNTYYAQNSSNISLPVSWNSDQGGNGSTPSSLDEDGNELVIMDGSDLILGANTNFGGLGTKFMVNGNAIITINSSVDNIFMNEVEIAENATLTLSSSSSKNITIGEGGLHINNNAQLDLGSNTLTLNGNAVINENGETGVLSIDNGSLVFNSTSENNSHLYLDNANNNIANLEINNTGFGNVQLMTPTNLRNVLKLRAGNLDTKDNLVLVHDANGVALIDKVEVGASLTGMVEYQRYWEKVSSSKYAFYHFGVPVKNQTLINWSDDFYIQGTNFKKPSAYSSVSSFIESTFSYESLTNGNNPLEPGKGYSAFMYPVDIADGIITYDNIGEPVIGDGSNNSMGSNEEFEFDLTYTNTLDVGDRGWNLISNPYPCIIDFNKLDWANASSEGVDAAIYVYDSDNKNYAYWSPLLDGPFYLYPGQAFYLKASGENPSLRITEDIKVTEGYTGAKVYRKGIAENLLEIKIQDSSGNSDLTYLGFREKASKGIDRLLDAKNIIGKSLSISSLIEDSTELSINALPLNDSSKLIPLRLKTNKKEVHKVSISGITSMTNNQELFFLDKYIDTLRHIDTEGFEYEFITNEEPNSANDRFQILSFPRPLLEISSSQGYQDELTNIKVKGSKLIGLTSAIIEINWDPELLKFHSVDSLSSNVVVKNISFSETENGILKFEIENSSINTADLFIINFIPLISNQIIDIEINGNKSSLFVENKIKIPSDIKNGTINVLDKLLAKGKVLYKSNLPIKNVRIKSVENENLYQTDRNGSFSLTVKEGQIYNLEIEEIDFKKYRINILDLIALNHYLYGWETINDPIDLLSADVNQDGNLNSSDFWELYRNIFKYKKNENTLIGKKWIIANSFDETNILPTPIAKATVNDIYNYNIDFDASILGDIIQENRFKNRRDGLPDTTTITLAESIKSKSVNYSIMAYGRTKLSGFQFRIHWDTNKLDLIDIEEKLENVLFNIVEDSGYVDVIWTEENRFLNIENELSLIGLNFEKRNNLISGIPLELSNTDSTTIFIDEDLFKTYVNLNEKTTDNSNSEIQNVMNFPNPFSNTTNLSFYLTQDQNLEITIFNSLGKIVKCEMKKFQKGFNTWEWSPDRELSKGIYLYQINGQTSYSNGKMIFK